MKKNVIIKIMFILLFLFTIFSQLNMVNGAYESSKIKVASSIGEIISGGSNFINTGESQTSPITTDNTKTLSQNLYNVLLLAGIIIAIIIGLILGMQFMTGSVEQKAKVKDSLIPYVAGCIVIFGAFGIWKLVVTILQGI